MTTTPDHAAEYTRADNAIRSLTTALAYQREAQGAINPLGGSSDTDHEMYATFVAMSEAVRRIEALIRRETARRDAAEMAQRAAAE